MAEQNDFQNGTPPTGAQCREAGLCLGNTRGLGCVCGAAFADGKPRPKTTAGEHEWQEWVFSRMTLTCCAKCGVVKAISGNRPCPGVVRLREVEKICHD